LCFFAGLVLALFFIFSGFFIVKDKVPKGWIWMYYASPFQWAQTSLVLNEFLSSKYNAICAAQQLAIATYCQKQDERLGRSYLAAYDVSS
jgi:ABC-type multidrug transport system permease subunit